MESGKRQVRLLTAEEVKLLGPRIDEMLDVGSYYDPRQDSLAVHGSLALFAAWAASAAQCRDTSQLPMIVGWLQSLEWEDEFGSIAVRAAMRLAGDDPELRARVHPLARTSSYSLAHPLISWLEPGRPAERKILEALCRSRSRYIAKAARKRLGSSGTVAWWEGYFEHDPSAGLDESEVSALQPKLARYMELLDAEQNEHADEILSLVRQFPPRAKAGACLRLLRQWGWHGAHFVSALAELLTLDGGARMLCDLVEKGEEMLHFEVCNSLEKLPETTTSEQRAAVAWEALSRLADVTWKEIDDSRGLPSSWAHMVTVSWPGDHDPTPVLDFLVEKADPEAEKPAYGVGYWSSMAKRLEPRWWPLLQERFEQALACDFVGRYSVLGPSLESVSERFPEAERRRMALGVLDRPESEHTVQWAVRALSQVDVAEVLSRLDDPKVRRHAFSLESVETFVRGRRELREGKLNPDEVGQVLHRIETLFGGTVNLGHRIRRRFSGRISGFADAEKKDTAAQEAVTAVAPELAGPVTDEEWALVRRLRAELTTSEVRKADLAFDFPDGPWAAEDLAWLGRLVEYVCTKEPDEAYFAAVVCAKHPCPEVLPLLEKLEAIPDPDRIGIDDSGTIADEVRRALGLPTKHGDGDDPEGEEEVDELDPDGTDDDW